MNNRFLLGCAGLAAIYATSASLAGPAQPESWRSQVIGAPPSQPYASPDLYQSGNECGTDHAEAEWDRNYKFLGYACVRPPSR